MKIKKTKLASRIRRGELLNENCPTREVLKHITSKWAMLVFVALGDGTLRFSELKRKVGGVTEKMLAQTLQVLENDGFVKRVSLPIVPPHVEYTLTPMGEEIGNKVATLGDWIESNLNRILKSRLS